MLSEPTPIIKKRFQLIQTSVIRPGTFWNDIKRILISKQPNLKFHILFYPIIEALFTHQIQINAFQASFN